MDRFLKIAHRGYSELYPENTIPAFEKAIEAGADMIEFDVHLSRDGKPVVIHDNDVDRTSNGRGFVKDMTLAELKELDFNFRMTGDAGAIRIPTLDEVIDAVSGRIMLNIELKNCPHKYHGVEEAVIAAIRDRGIRDQVIVSSFDHYALLKVKELAPEIRTGMLYEGGWLRFQDEVLELEVYSIHPAIDTIDVDQLAWARENGYRIYVWVATRRKEIVTLTEGGLVDGIMVNDLTLFEDNCA